MNNVYAEDPKARINVGIRRRLAPLMDNDQDKIKLMNVLLMSLPGTPVLYYGDEIGMGDNIYLKDRDGVRTPMQWDNNLNAGFSEADPHSLYMPVIQNTEYSYQWVNVKRQEANPNSLLNWTKELLANRKAHKVFGRGSLKFLDPENPHLLVFLRKFEQETILVVINLSRHAQATELELADFAGAQPREIFGGSTFPQVGEGPYPITIGPLSYYWLQLETDRHLGVDYRNLSSSSLNVISLNDLLTRNNQKKLSTSVLPPYLENVGWMGEHRTNIESVKVLNFQLTSIGEETFGWLLMKLTYRKGSPETVQLPVAFAPFDGESQDKEEVISLVDIGGEMMVMYDALYNANYRASVVEGKSFDADVAAFRLQANEEMQSAEKSTVNIRHSGTEYALLQSPGLNVKFYRRLGVEPSPDLETKSLLTAKDFAASPKVLGSLHYKPNGKMNATLAIFERRLGEDTTGAGYVHNELRTFASDLVQKLEQTADLEANISDLVDGNFVGKIQELGQIIATFHQLVNGEKATPNFSTEAMSLHYQRSVYAGLKGDVRETITLLKKHFPQLDVDAAGLAEAIIAQEGNIHTKLKRIYDHKLESDKIRIHGDFTLEQVALSGGKFLIKNFDGDPDLPFSQRRLRRSPAKDLANLMRSISYASGLVLEEQSSDLDNDVADRLEIWLRQASDHLSSALVSAYQEETAGSRLLPADETDLTVLLDAFRIEKSLQELRYDLRYRIGQVKIPLRGLLGLLE
jgi:maltose alpha-D-glucosyltransferase/alpha-amylase